MYKSIKKIQERMDELVLPAQKDCIASRNEIIALVYLVAPMWAQGFGNSDYEDVASRVICEIEKVIATYDKQKGAAFHYFLKRRFMLRMIDAVRNTTRRSHRDTAYLVDPTTTKVTPFSHHEIDRPVLVRSLQRAFKGLNPQERVCLEYFLDHEMSDTEIARKLSEPLGTIKSRIRRGKEKLREHLERDQDIKEFYFS